MLRAGNNMSYREFHAVLKLLWNRVHPDIPIRPVQSEAFAKYPVIAYSLELRKPHPTEPKKRYREEIIGDDGTMYSIYGHRFQNLISFSAITRNDPELAEAIIEEFELFMDSVIGTLKELGASEILYSRRLSDREQERVADDVSIRSVAYMVTLERLNFIIEDRLEEIVADVRLFLDHQRVPTFEVTDSLVGTNEILILHNNTVIDVEDRLILKSIDNVFFRFPAGFKTGHSYLVTSVRQNDAATPFELIVGLSGFDGGTVVSESAGKGNAFHDVRDNIETLIVDQLAQGATPST
jgi:hypothetical protein